MTVKDHGIQSEFMLGSGHADIQLQEYFCGQRPWPSGQDWRLSRDTPPTKGTIAWQEALDRFGAPTPNESQFLECYLNDMQSVVRSVGFEEWADNYGLDSDSRKAEAMYHRVLKEKNEFYRLVGFEAFTEFVAITEDD